MCQLSGACCSVPLVVTAPASHSQLAACQSFQLLEVKSSLCVLGGCFPSNVDERYWDEDRALQEHRQCLEMCSSPGPAPRVPAERWLCNGRGSTAASLGTDPAVLSEQECSQGSPRAILLHGQMRSAAAWCLCAVPARQPPSLLPLMLLLAPFFSSDGQQQLALMGPSRLFPLRRGEG